MIKDFKTLEDGYIISKSRAASSYENYSRKLFCEHISRIYGVNLKCKLHAEYFRCNQCVYTTYSLSKVYAHKRREHLYSPSTFPGKFIRCNQCSYRTYSLSKLIAHKRREHLNSPTTFPGKFIRCNECQYRTYTLSKVIAHKRLEHIYSPSAFPGKFIYTSKKP